MGRYINEINEINEMKWKSEVQAEGAGLQLEIDKQMVKGASAMGRYINEINK